MRQLWDWKASADVDTMAPRTCSKVYGEICGWTLARAHARSGDRVAIASYLGSSDAFDRAIARFAAPTPSRTTSTTAPSPRPSAAEP